MTNNKNPRILKTQIEMNTEFNEQMQLLESQLRYFDNGERLHYKTISTSIRKFLHDTRMSKSLFTSLDLKERSFFSTLNDETFNKPFAVSEGSRLVSLWFHEGKAKYSAILEAPIYAGRMCSFEEWWNEEVIDSSKEEYRLSRKDIVLNIADTDGGAHVDTDEESSYRAIKYGEALGVRAIINGEEEVIPELHIAILRQIAYEFMRTMSYIKKDPYPELSLKEKCSCGSEKKYKHCCCKKRWNQNIENSKLRQFNYKQTVKATKDNVENRVLKPNQKVKSVEYGLSNLQVFKNISDYNDHFGK